MILHINLISFSVKNFKYLQILNSVSREIFSRGRSIANSSGNTLFLVRFYANLMKRLIKTKALVQVVALNCIVRVRRIQAMYFEKVSVSFFFFSYILHNKIEVAV